MYTLVATLGAFPKSISLEVAITDLKVYWKRRRLFPSLLPSLSPSLSYTRILEKHISSILFEFYERNFPAESLPSSSTSFFALCIDIMLYIRKLNISRERPFRFNYRKPLITAGTIVPLFRISISLFFCFYIQLILCLYAQHIQRTDVFSAKK